MKLNINYPNNRGGCTNGYCEMPINLNSFGYKQFNENMVDNIICYNCKNTNGCRGLNCNKCCEEQKDKVLYPNLKSPDYAFDNDNQSRINFTDTFKKNNMSPIKLLA